MQHRIVFDTPRERDVMRAEAMMPKDANQVPDYMSLMFSVWEHRDWGN